MKGSLIAVALLVVTLSACAHAQQNTEPNIVRTLAAAILLPLGPLGKWEVFVDEPSFLTVEQAVDGEEFRAAAISALLDRPVRTDLATVAVVCPEGRLCHLPGNPFIMSVENVSREGDHIRIRMRYMYNLGSMRSIFAHDVTVLRVERGWRIVSLVRHEH